jgi:IS1 family transposase
MGDRSEKTCRELWHAIPENYRFGRCFTDFWHAYQVVILLRAASALDKETGGAAHVERWEIRSDNIWGFLFVSLSLSPNLL